jgi:hypothetical protein
MPGLLKLDGTPHLIYDHPLCACDDRGCRAPGRAPEWWRRALRRLVALLDRAVLLPLARLSWRLRLVAWPIYDCEQCAEHESDEVYDVEDLERGPHIHQGSDT